MNLWWAQLDPEYIELLDHSSPNLIAPFLVRSNSTVDFLSALVWVTPVFGTSKDDNDFTSAGLLAEEVEMQNSPSSLRLPLPCRCATARNPEKKMTRFGSDVNVHLLSRLGVGFVDTYNEWRRTSLGLHAMARDHTLAFHCWCSKREILMIDTRSTSENAIWGVKVLLCILLLYSLKHQIDWKTLTLTEDQSNWDKCNLRVQRCSSLVQPIVDFIK